MICYGQLISATQIGQAQENVVNKCLADGLSPVEWESLEMLVTDGGTVSPNDIVTKYNRHPDSVRRALDVGPEGGSLTGVERLLDGPDEVVVVSPVADSH